MGHSNDDGFAICHISAGIGYCYCVVGSGPWISQYRYIQDNEFTLQLFRCNISFRAYSWSSYLSNNVGIKLQYRCCGSVLSSVQILFSFVSNSLIIHNYHIPKQRKIIFKPSIKVYHIIVVMHKFVNLTLALQELLQGSQIRQNCSDDSTEVTEGVTSTPEIFGNKQGATLTPEIFGNKHSFVLTFFATNAIYVNCKRCKP